mgnify:FL=1|jgi:hypothetical protein
MSTEKPTPAQVSRPRRTPIGRRNRLSVENRDPDYQYRIVNDVDGRVQDLLDQDYEIVLDAKVGDKRVDEISSLGSAKQISVGNGIKAVVMKKRKDWFKDDQDLKQKEIDDLEASMNIAAKRGL